MRTRYQEKCMRYKEPLFIMVLLALMIFEIPYLNFFLIAPIIGFIYYSIFRRTKLGINYEIIILSIFISSYFLIDTTLIKSMTYKIFYTLSVICIYRNGRCVIYKGLSSYQKSVKTEKIIRFISISYFIYVFISIIYSFQKGQFMISRNPLNIWNGELRAATHYGTMLILPVSYAIFVLFKASKKSEKILGAFIITFAVITSLMTASRTILYVIPIGVFACYYIDIKIQGKLTNKNFCGIVIFIVLIFIGIFIFESNILGVQDKILSTQLGNRISNGQVSSLADDGRIKNISYLFSHMGESLFGGGYTRRNSGWLHNIFLDTYDLSGIIPLIFLILYTITVIRNTKYILKSNMILNSTKVLIFIVLTLSLIQSLLEPIMESVPVFFWCIIYISGLISNLKRYV